MLENSFDLDMTDGLSVGEIVEYLRTKGYSDLEIQDMDWELQPKEENIMQKNDNLSLGQEDQRARLASYPNIFDIDENDADHDIDSDDLDYDYDQDEFDYDDLDEENLDAADDSMLDLMVDDLEKIVDPKKTGAKASEVLCYIEDNYDLGDPEIDELIVGSGSALKGKMSPLSKVIKVATGAGLIFIAYLLWTEYNVDKAMWKSQKNMVQYYGFPIGAAVSAILGGTMIYNALKPSK